MPLLGAVHMAVLYPLMVSIEILQKKCGLPCFYVPHRKRIQTGNRANVVQMRQCILYCPIRVRCGFVTVNVGVPLLCGIPMDIMNGSKNYMWTHPYSHHLVPILYYSKIFKPSLITSKNKSEKSITCAIFVMHITKYFWCISLDTCVLLFHPFNWFCTFYLRSIAADTSLYIEISTQSAKLRYGPIIEVKRPHGK